MREEKAALLRRNRQSSKPARHSVDPLFDPFCRANSSSPPAYIYASVDPVSPRRVASRRGCTGIAGRKKRGAEGGGSKERTLDAVMHRAEAECTHDDDA